MIEDQRQMSWCRWSEGGGTSDRLEEEVVNIPEHEGYAYNAVSSHFDDHNGLRYWNHGKLFNVNIIC